ncbi:cobaltochelatase subunit CobN [Acetobacterium fimetarium]|uniref:Cobaltochelatase subunit CobN n=1 Tax=Acetobacterium fimetarium TaxID=52691 RepID=A0ABR6WRF7_9FIRM|nr:cobaltochelatase subunit CobN [Acetobacterium fimetarium]MBC3803102.1 cobaltochelatase subunit CobN [Acetobacterium fimetarium]
MTMKLAFCSANGTELAILSKAIKLTRTEYEIDVYARKNKEFDDPEVLDEFIGFAQNSDFLIICLHGGKNNSIGFDRIVAAMPASVKIYVHYTNPIDALVSAEYSTVDKSDYVKLNRYLTYSGCENYHQALLYLLTRSDKISGAYQEPAPLPWEGIYHPDFETLPTLTEYLNEKFEKGRLSVGIWFHREHWTNADTKYVDAFIREFESRGINVIPVFRKTRCEEDLGNMGLAEILTHYFKNEEKPIVDVIVNLMSFSASMMSYKSNVRNQSLDAVLADFGVPVLKAMVAFADRESWQASTQGLSPVDVIANAALPEMDGNIITLAGAFTDSSTRDPLTGARIVVHQPDGDGIRHIVDIAENWAKLKHLKNKDKKVAILFHNYPPRNDTIGSAFGLDSKDSVFNILNLLKENGYYLETMPENGTAIIDELLSKTTNDLRWAAPEQMVEKAVDTIPKPAYEAWFGELSQKVQDEMTEFWDQPPGEFFCHQGKLAVPGIINGNIFIGMQPPRGNTLNPESVYHSPDLPMPHNYYAYYEWIREVFKADAIIHVGMHGSLEWLPGKALGLSESCYPRIAIEDLPHLYIYIINNPGEGTQAKRRSNCCIIDHMIPVMARAELYDETAALETQLQDYYKCKAMDPGKLGYLQKIIWEKVLEINLHRDLNRDDAQPADFDEFLEQLHDYLSELKETQIKTGLHTLGEAPIGEKRIELLAAMTQLPNGETPSLRQSIASFDGYNLDELLDNRGKLNNNGKTNADVLEDIYAKSIAFLEVLAKTDFAKKQIDTVCNQVFGCVDSEIQKVAIYICTFLVPRLADCQNELTAITDGLDGKFIKPGPTGSPSRGMAHILPTGRNFYSIDPQTVPSPTAWEAGKRLADDMLEKYQKEQGQYPENVGMVVFGTSTMRTGGEDEAEILYLLGVRPIWQKQNAYVRELEVIPLDELGRPRIDVTTRISGLFRDTFPNLVDLLDRAVLAVADLDEPEEMNFVAKHVRKDIEEMLEKGIDYDRAREESSYRIFGCKPGAYGAGVCNIIDTKQWNTVDDLAQIYLTWGGYAYSRKTYGKQLPELFKKRLSVMDAAVMNLDSREFEMIDSDDFYSFHGGMIASVRAFKGEDPLGLVGDSSNPERIKTRTVSEGTRFELRSRVFNPKWIASMKEHGYKGAGDISQIVDHIFGWDVTAQVMDDQLYEELAKKFALDPEFSDWLRDVNPWALQNISERLLEAVQRKMWDADDKMVAELRKIYLEMEGAAEEC